MDKGLWILPMPKKGDHRVTKNKKVTALTAIAAKVYNALLLNYIWPEIEKSLLKKSEWF